jgi:hypothetical protein
MNQATIDEVFERIVSAFDGLADEIDAMQIRVSENSAALKSAPSEHRLSELRSEIISATGNMNRETVERLDEKIGNVREAILSETARANQAALNEHVRAHEKLRVDLRDIITGQLDAVLPARVEHVFEALEETRAEARAKRIARLKGRAQLWTSLVLFGVAIASLALQFSGGIPKQIPVAARTADRLVQ